MTVLAVTNQKGGVGKTTTVVNLGAYLGSFGARVLLVDCDPQANTTSGVGASVESGGVYDVLTNGVAARDRIVKSDTRGVDLLPSTADLAGAEIELLDADDRTGVLKTAIEPLESAYSYILLDCPPSLGLLTFNALVAADAVIVPVQCEYLALEGLARLISTLERVRQQSNPRLQIFGLLMTMYDSRTSLSQQVTAEVKDHYPNLIFDTVIPRSVRLSEAPSFGKPILSYDPHSRGAEAYAQLAVEVASRAAGVHSKRASS